MKIKKGVCLRMIVAGFAVCSTVVNAAPLVIANWNDEADPDYTVGVRDALTAGTLPALTVLSKFGAGALDLTDSSTQMSLEYDGNYSTDKGTFEVFINPADVVAGTGYYIYSVIFDASNRIYFRREMHSNGTQQRLFAYYQSAGTAAYVSTTWLDKETGPLALDEWHHIALTWDFTKGGGANELAIYIDGSRDGYNAAVLEEEWGSGVAPTTIGIGCYGTAAVAASAYLDSMKISDDVVYSGESVTVPTQEFDMPVPPIGSPLLIAHWNSTADADVAIGVSTAFAELNSVLPGIVSTPSVLGGGALNYTNDTPALYFDAANNFNASAGTFELFMNPVEGVASQKYYIYSMTPASGYRVYFRREVHLNGTQQRLWAYYESAGVSKYVATAWEFMSTGSLALGEWHHVAFTWDFTKGGGTNELAIFIDGSRAAYDATVTAEAWVDSVYPDGMRIDIGRYGTSAADKPGSFFDELRISGVVMYTGESYTIPANEFDFGADLDTDGDGIADWWETTYYGGPTNAVPDTLAASGRHTNLEAYIAGLAPWETFELSLFSGSQTNLVQWDGREGRTYWVYSTPDLVNEAFSFETNVSWEAAEFIDLVSSNSSKFYQVGVTKD
ncbi:LamG-like jellyroll fold domain-containing protein [Tichowtungia aerotolerans]|uniref:LamG domain-containing protein n=1 Tax=Tichowtungia aerotolerans TaxID=2697043 RepID=A0A6P1M5C5_9BACT|nr:LamG-like jellyroll fold domain-containing protein [Tichowtungia aerotolerans]QHI69041.1 hypothetical protein GT409_06145 [Tichowtungia aerotolerans]